MDEGLQYLLSLFLVLIEFSEANPYCHIRNCANNVHTLCKYPVYNPSLQYGYVLSKGVSEFEEYRIIELHNYYRNYVYSGLETRGNPGPLPKSLYKRYLKWDDELATIAQAWAEQCTLSHDICRNVDRWVVGQNYGFETTVGYNLQLLTVDLIIQKWYEEVQRFNKSSITAFNRQIAKTTFTEHFSQMIWINTARIGCGAMRYFNGLYGRFFLVCNYGPKGNYGGVSVYPALNT